MAGVGDQTWAAATVVVKAILEAAASNLTRGPTNSKLDAVVTMAAREVCCRLGVVLQPVAAHTLVAAGVGRGGVFASANFSASGKSTQ